MQEWLPHRVIFFFKEEVRVYTEVAPPVFDVLLRHTFIYTLIKSCRFSTRCCCCSLLTPPGILVLIVDVIFTVALSLPKSSSSLLQLLC